MKRIKLIFTEIYMVKNQPEITRIFPDYFSIRLKNKTYMTYVINLIQKNIDFVLSINDNSRGTIPKKGTRNK